MSRLVKMKAVGATAAALSFAQNRQMRKPVAAAGASKQEITASCCALLPRFLVEGALEQQFNAPVESNVPPAYGNQLWGSNCRYSSKTGRTTVVFIVYVDASPQEAKQNFDRLAMWFSAKSIPSGIGGSAYVDKGGAIHVLKDKVRYYLSVDPTIEKQLKGLAASVAARL